MTWRVEKADCIEAMAAMDDASVDAIVCDPPYGIRFMGQAWDGADIEAAAQARAGQAQPPHKDGSARENPRVSRAEEAGKYDLSPTANQAFQAWCQEWASGALRVLKPGGHMLVFGGTRTYHRLAAGIEDAGFEIRDCLAYMFGSGFPKSHNLDRLRGEQICGCGDDQRPAGASAPQHGVPGVRKGDLSAAIDDGSQHGSDLLKGLPQSDLPVTDRSESGQGATGSAQRVVEGRSDALAEGRELPTDQVRPGAGMGAADGAEGRLHHGTPAADRSADRSATDEVGGGASPGSRSDEQRAEQSGALADERLAQDGRGWPDCARCGLPVVPRGLGTALKPAFEPIVVARKPLAGTVAANILEHGVGGLNIDGCRLGLEGKQDHWDRYEPSGRMGYQGADGEREGGAYNEKGRWPANVVLDGAAAVVLDEQTGESVSRVGAPRASAAPGDGWGMTATGAEYADRGGASRFFYCAKASRAERNAGLEGFDAKSLNWSAGDQSPGTFQSDGTDKTARNSHPTVKPIALMRWLVRLVAPPGGLVLDPFTGSGTTGCATVLEGFDFLGIEREAEYVAIAEARIAHVEANGEDYLAPAAKAVEQIAGQLDFESEVAA